MITVPAGMRVLVASKPVDFRRGAESLIGLVREHLGHDPFSGTIYVFRSKRADRLKIVAWDGSGLVYSGTMCIHTTPPSSSAEGFDAIATLRAVTRSTSRFHLLHCLRGRLDTGSSYR